MSFFGLPPLPDEARPILPFMLRAQEMAPRDPAIAYWCKMHAARLALQNANAIPGIRPWLFALMDALEKEKADMAAAGNDFITDESVAQAHIENFALKIFAAADREDRAGKASMRTAKTFLAASNYLEVLSVFRDEFDEQTREKIKYAKWKATDIIKAIKAGETPRPGPPGEDTDDATNGDFPQQPSQPQQPPADVFPGQSLPPPAEHPTAPPTSGSSGNTTVDLPPAPSHSFPGYGASAPSAPPAFHTTQPSQPPVYQHQQYGAPQTGVHHFGAPPAATVTAATSALHSPSSALPVGNLPDPHVVQQVQKHARFVISALEYDDVGTAADNLRKALALLAPFETRK